jgi:hypothetical protein
MKNENLILKPCQFPLHLHNLPLLILNTRKHKIQRQNKWDCQFGIKVLMPIGDNHPTAKAYPGLLEFTTALTPKQLTPKGTT